MTILDFRALASVLQSRLGFSNRAGVTYAGARDTFEALGYKPDLEPEDFWSRYKRNSVAARIIEAYPYGTWRGEGASLVEDPDPKVETDFEKAWKTLNTRLNLWPMMMRTDILAGLGRFSVALLGAPGDLRTPLARVTTGDALAFVSCYSELDVEPIDEKDLVTNTSDPRFGKPKLYRLKRLRIGASQASQEVHWTRIIHVADGMLDDPIYGQPRLERVWNLLDDLEKITGAGSEAFWMRAHQGYQFDIDKETRFAEGEEEKLEEEVDNFVNGIRRFARTRGVKLTTLGSDVAMFDRNVDSLIALISSGTGIPQRILMGSERGQLASQQDRINWAERIQDRRREFATPVVVQQLVQRLIEFGYLPEPKQYDPVWPQVQDLSDDERAGIAQKWADVNQKNVKAGGVVVTPDEIRDQVLGLGPFPKGVPRVPPEAKAPAPVAPPAAPQPQGGGAVDASQT